MNTLFYMIVAMVLGALVTVQPLLNTILARAIGSPYGATTVAIGVACLFGIAVITVVIRYYGAYPEGISFAILIMNAFVPLINTYFKPRRFGSKIKSKII